MAEQIEYFLAYNIKYSDLKNYSTPFRDPYFEIAVGAILTQSTAWKSVAIAINNLYKEKVLTPKKILNLTDDELGALIKPAGYFKQKTKKIKIFCEWLINNNSGNLQNLKNKKVLPLRAELLSLWGIGPETADSILLYALNKEIFVIDEYTRRLCRTRGLEFKNYDDYRLFFEKSLSKEKNKIKLFQEYHALIVASGKEKHQNIMPGIRQT